VAGARPAAEPSDDRGERAAPDSDGLAAGRHAADEIHPLIIDWPQRHDEE
jgi:hypothetical protein